MKKLLLLAALFAAATAAASQQMPDSLLSRLMNYAVMARNFGKTLPQEKAYLHLDNTSYYQGDKIWFQCYVATAGTNRPTQLSRALHVELLNPGGNVVDRRVLPIVDGRCNGNFSLTQLPFYSGFYEIRAYTKYMLNFGEQTIFSRTIPIFDKPHDESDTAEKRMIRPRSTGGKYPVKRKFEGRERRVNMRFYPEGGNLVEGLQQRVAFEITDADGHAIALAGRVCDKSGNVKAEFAAVHDGRGAFDITPAEGDRALIVADGKSYDFALPQVQTQGVSMRLDNLSSTDSLTVEVCKNAATPAIMLGAAVISNGALASYNILDLSDETPLRFAVDKRKLSPGTARMLLIDPDGQIVADRIFFARTGPRASISVTTDKDEYEPYDSVRLDVALCDEAGAPLRSPLSISVRDGQDEAAYGNDLRAELLLMSEIRGYVHRPSYYFEADDPARREALDLLLMVQGWRRYKWEWWSGTEPFDLKYLPEHGVEVHGQVLRYGTDKPMTDIHLSSILLKRGEEDIDEQGKPAEGMSHVGVIDVDSTGHFTFVGNMWGKWSLILTVTNDKNRRKASRILLDRAFSPEPREYGRAEMNVEIAADTPTQTARGPEADTVKQWTYDDDEDPDKDMTERVHRIEEVVVKGKKRSREEDIYRSRSTSAAYYDVPAEIDAIRDRGENIREIHELLAAINDKFMINRMSVTTLGGLSSLERDTVSSAQADNSQVSGQWRITYKGKDPLFVVDYERVWGTVSIYDLIRISAIKAIYVNEDMGVIMQYADLTKMSPREVSDRYSCAVLIETYPDGQVPVDGARGVRKTWIDGYTEPDEFYMPDYSVLPKENDYRRTLYWNPALVPDEQGRASVTFYNNSRCRRMKVSAQTLSTDGAIGVAEK